MNKDLVIFSLKFHLVSILEDTYILFEIFSYIALETVGLRE
jgi:hypothetical protein